MKKTALLALVSALALASCTRTPTPVAPVAPIGQLVYGLTASGQLVTFGLDNANASLTTVSVSGIGNGETLVDLDVRNTDNRLYGFSNTGTVYRFNVTAGTTTVTGTAVDDSTVALSGATVVAADFNPVANRLRVVGTSDLNFRHTVSSAPVNATGGTTADGTFAFVDTNAAKNPNIAAAAYTNSFNNSANQAVNAGTTTDLYTVDADLDVLVKHSVGPQFNAMTSVGALGQDVSVGSTGFDIAGASAAYLSSNAGSNTTFYTVNLTTGAATLKTTVSGVSLKSFALGLATQ
ncbi:DUF4394 domain-containing protein [Deinococcus sp. HMF7620]|uniref:DUF4394 domain-containing protein n=1 Tax=Deinococcus arboris TaxID=2682977 RepID=A0A7C9HRW0_9DEIO|nr:DUF4394 domain-containing protein [Deinococcus arboris]MVN87334.1 DUF4394 domain-containing protein [Deinococcus arboris]